MHDKGWIMKDIKIGIQALRSIRLDQIIKCWFVPSSMPYVDYHVGSNTRLIHRSINIIGESRTQQQAKSGLGTGDRRHLGHDEGSISLLYE
jgi:hypothetical protein